MDSDHSFGLNGTMGSVTDTEPPAHADALATLWDRQSVWSRSAGRLKKRIFRARMTGLLLAVLGALLGTASAWAVDSSPGTARWLAIAAAVVLAALPVLAREAGPSVVIDWTRTRAVSEALKAEIYTYLSGTSPYRGEDRMAALLDRTEKIVIGNDQLARHTAGILPKSRKPPQVTDVDSYAKERVEDQIDEYYRPTAGRVRRKLVVFTRIEVLLTWAAAALASVTAIEPALRLSAWAGTITTIAGAFAIHVAAERLEQQEITYSSTADRLSFLLLTHAEQPRTDAGDDRFVRDCEQVIATENQAWMADQTATDQPGSPPSGSPGRASAP